MFRMFLFFVFWIAALWGFGCATMDVAPLRLKGVWVEVGSRDTLESISAHHGADPVVVAELNNLASCGDVSSRGELFVPAEGGSLPGDGRPAKTPSVKSEPQAQSVRAVRNAQGTCVAEPCLAWPVDGEVMAVFDVRRQAPHDGLDIRAPEGTSIRAAASGKVLYSGDGIKGYGNMVILRHEQGLVTVYAHALRNLVKEGETVEQGAVVAEVGRTGNAREPHLHFEVRQREDPTDPLNYLPPRSDHGRENR